MKKYLFIIPSLSKGGAERVVSLLSNELSKNLKEVTIVVHYRCHDEYKIDKKVKIICLTDMYDEEYKSKINFLFLTKLLIRLRKTIKKEKPDYIIPFLWTTCLRAELALMFSKYRKKIIHTVRNNPNSFPNNSLLKKIRNFMILRAKNTIVQNEEQRKYFKKVSDNKIFILPNPVPKELLKIKHKTNNKYINIIGVGRLEKQKNFDLLIDAFYELHKDLSNIVLNIYGEGSLKQHLTDKINEYNLNLVVNLKGRCNEYSKIYKDADIFVLSSDNEGMPNALLEAMAVGIPCISTNCPTGPSEIIVNKKNGILIKTGDKEELVKALLYLINNQDSRIKIGKNAKEHILNNYSVEEICNRFINICEK